MGGNMILPQIMNGGNLDSSIIDADNSLINNSMMDQGVFDQMNTSTIDMNNVNVSIIHPDDEMMPNAEVAVEPQAHEQSMDGQPAGVA